MEGVIKEAMGITAAVITASDRSYKGERDDLSGPLLRELLASKEIKVVEYKVLPDEEEILFNEMKKMVEQKIDLILTTGGTGLTARDVTPEATMKLTGRVVPGIPELMRAQGFTKSRHSVLSRAVCVQSGKTLIVNMPGSPKAVKESFDLIWPAVQHAVELINGLISDCHHSKHKT